MHRRLLLALAAAAFASSLTVPGTAPGATIQDDPLAVIRDTNDKAKRILRPGHRVSGAEREDVVHLIEGTSDFPAIARRIFGARWDAVVEADRRRFVEAFGRLVALTSIEKMGRYRADRIEYLGQKVNGGGATVATRAYYRGKAVALEYEMQRDAHGAWRIVDYSLNGVSSATGYRRQFEKILARGGFGDLLRRLDARLAELEKNAQR